MELSDDFDAMLRAGGSPVSKVEAARRQLDVAIRLFFSGGDEVALHTLVMAAHVVLRDLCRMSAINESIGDTALVSGDDLKYVIDSGRVPQNFFKHADKDGDATINFFPCVTQFWLADAVRMFVLLVKGPIPRSMRVFFMWFQLRFPDLLKLESAYANLAEIRASLSDPDDFKRVAHALMSNEN